MAAGFWQSADQIRNLQPVMRNTWPTSEPLNAEPLNQVTYERPPHRCCSNELPGWPG